MSKNRSYINIGFIEALTLIFISAKVFGFIDWSWWLVCLPVLIPAGILVLALLLIGIIYIITALSALIRGL